jgi:hypothetical protein
MTVEERIWLQNLPESSKNNRIGRLLGWLIEPQNFREGKVPVT